MNNKATPYDRAFYDWQKTGSNASASVILPLVFSLAGRPGSILDVGCGVGPWLRAALDLGVDDIFGIDGDWVDETSLLIPRERFQSCDLSQGFRLGRRFDLTLCLEVAEHLPETVAPRLVESLTQSSDVLLFSAAMPGQKGSDHINEQWPEYWDRLFEQHGFFRLDAIRPHIWRNPSIDWWYRQNAFIYMIASLVEGKPEHRKERELTTKEQLTLVKLEIAHHCAPPSVATAVARLQAALLRKLKRRRSPVSM
jgi:hypothetical protein